MHQSGFDKKRQTIFRRYPALGFIVAAAALALLLPSALTIPQSNPNTLAEFAPVPGTGTGVGDLSSLGSGFSNTFDPGREFNAPPDSRTSTPAQRKAKLKRCVGSPPRQTEDPLSPPCVAFFEGENGGATYRGVTKDEVRILVYFTAGNPTQPPSGFVDLGLPPSSDEHFVAGRLRDLQRYFNDRYQTYNRSLHFFVHFSSAGSSPAQRQADAIDGMNRAKPFAVISEAIDNSDAYAETFAKQGVLVFGGDYGRPASQFQKYPKLIWSYVPSLEQQADLYTSFLCTKVVPFPVSVSGNVGENGTNTPRRFGLLYQRPASKAFADLIRTYLKRCGGNLVSEAPAYGGSVGAGAANDAVWIAQFRNDRVTTILWPYPDWQGASRTAASSGYLPEWILAGNGLIEMWNQSQVYDQAAWDHAWVVSNVPQYPALSEELCYQALKEANPRVDRGEAISLCLRWVPIYGDLRQFVTAVQIAGPRLTPDNIYRGFLAVPPIASSNPKVPSCYSVPNDYSCIKDAVSMYWDSKATALDSGAPGCWRMPENGKRYLARSWPHEDMAASKLPSDACNNFGYNLYEARI